MKKLIFLILIFIVACTPQSSGNQKSIDVYVGFEGLIPEFAKNAPPPKVFEKSEFPVMLRIKNKGAYSVGARGYGLGILTVARETDYVTDIKVKSDGEIDQGHGIKVIEGAFFSVGGKTQINANGDELVVTMDAKTGKLDLQSEQKLTTITATLCYPYQTVLATTVCVDTDVAGLKPGKKVCTAKDQAFANGQGAPVAITKIETIMIPEGNLIKPQFMIFIENKGRGNTVNLRDYSKICGKDPLEKSSAGTTLRDVWNVGSVTASISGGSSADNQLVCCPNINGQCDGSSPVGFLRFNDKKDFVRCTFKKGFEKGTEAFTTPLKIVVDYGYVQTTSASFVIQKPLSY